MSFVAMFGWMAWVEVHCLAVLSRLSHLFWYALHFPNSYVVIWYGVLNFCFCLTDLMWHALLVFPKMSMVILSYFILFNYLVLSSNLVPLLVGATGLQCNLFFIRCCSPSPVSCVVYPKAQQLSGIFWRKICPFSVVVSSWPGGVVKVTCLITLVGVSS